MASRVRTHIGVGAGGALALAWLFLAGSGPLGQADAQTSVYLRAGAPASQTITGATNATPIVIQTIAAHGFSPSCNTTTNICYCGPTGVPTGTGPSPANGVRECVYVDATHLALYDLSGNPVAGTGNWWPGYTPFPGINPAAQWVGALTKYTIPANPGPLGYFDGTNGDLMRKVSTGTQNGLVSLVTTGCPSACVATETLSYDPTAMKIPVAAGQHFSITGTGTALDTCGDGTAASGAQSPYTVASVTSSTIVSSPFACSISNQDYTNINLHCGPAPTPNDTIGGTQPCTRVSLMAHTANPVWNAMLTVMSINNLTSSPNYKTTFDGGVLNPQSSLHGMYGMAAVRFLVDPTNSLWLNEILYSLNHDERTNGVGYTYNSGAYVFQSNSMYNYTTDMEGLSLSYGVASPYWTASEKSTFLNRIYNDSDDPGAINCTTTNQDAANPGTHNWVLSSGLLASGTNDSTHAQLPASDPHYSTVDFYKNTVIMLDNGSTKDYNHASFGLITGQNSSGVLTVSSWVNGNGGGGVAPALNNVVSGTYQSGLTCTGSPGQTVSINFSNGGGSNGQGLVALTGTNTIASGTPLTITMPGTGYSSGPTSGTTYQWTGSVSYTCSGTATVSTSIGTPYTIFDTITISSKTAGAAATVTFTKTPSLSGTINTGDGIMAYNGWGGNFTVGQNLSYVSSVGSNTLSVINAGGVTASTSTPMMAWRIPQWTTGDCGRLRATKTQSSNSLGVQAAVYGPGVSASINPANGFIGDTYVNGGGNSPTAWMIFDLAAAPDDSRAIRDLARSQGYMFDYGIRPLIDFSTGRLRDGPGYSMDEDAPAVESFMWAMLNSIPSYPTLDVTGPWAQNLSVWDMFETLPDLEGGLPELAGWAGAGSQVYSLTRNGATSYGLALNPTVQFAPASNKAAWFRNWQETVSPGGTLWGYTESDRQGLSFLHNDPRVADLDYKAQPHQFAFNISSSVTSLTGWPQQYRGDAVISRTGWSSPSDTLEIFDSATNSSNGGVYDSPRVGQLSVWKTGCLLGADSNPCNGMWGQDPSTLSDAFSFGAGGMSQFQSGAWPNIGYTPLTRWASANAGSNGTQYGDSQSRYAAACTDAKANYNQANLGLSLDHVQICWADLKKAGNDQFIFQFHDAALTSGTAAMAWHLHYPQNGTTQTGGSVSMSTGSTTYMGSNVIKSVQDGGGTVPRTHGLMTYVTSPGTITLRDDCVGLGGGGQCAPGNTYPGGSGYTHRFTIAGGASVGAAVSQFASVVVHKVMSTLSDTTLTTVNLNPDANWTGVQACGAVSCAVFLGARKGTTYSAVTQFTTTHSGTAQYLVTGLTAGSYNVTMGGSPVLTGVTVTAGDNSLYFESTAGAVSISQTGVPPTIATVSLPASTAGIAYSQTLAAVGGATPYTWSVSSGSLPHNLTLNSSSGAIGGTPDTAGTSSFTVTVTGADTLSASASLSIVINPALLVTTTSLPGGTLSAAYSQTLAANGGTGTHTWAITAGALPGGLQFDPNSGTISGTPTAAGAFNFTVVATDSVGAIGSKALSIAVLRPAGTTAHGTTLRRVTAH